MENCVDNLKITLQTEIETNKDSLNTLLANHKIVATIVKGPELNIKTIKISTEKRKAPKSRLSEEEVKKLTEIKKSLKGNTDAMYFLTLIARVNDIIKKIDLNVIPIEGLMLIEETKKHLFEIVSKTALK